MLALLLGFFYLIKFGVVVNGIPNIICHTKCHAAQSIDVPFVLPDKFKDQQYDSLCQVGLIFDHVARTIKVTFGGVVFGGVVFDDDDFQRREVKDNDEPYDYASENIVLNSTSIITNLFYSCTLGDRCEEKFLLSMISKLAKRNYQKIQRNLMDIFSTFPDSNSPRCYQEDGKIVTCNGTCNDKRIRNVDLTTGKPDASNFKWPVSCGSQVSSPIVYISAVKMPISARLMFLHRSISFSCSKDLCNRPTTIDRIEQIVNENDVSFYQ